ncbi:MAG: peptide chain release factor N(5)-glutamine methyltransferase [Nonlabens sp.]
MTLQCYKKRFVEQLSHLYSQKESHSILQIACEDLLNWSRTDFMIRDREEMTHLQEQILNNALEQLKSARPIQYITNKSHFFGLELKVNESVLIPRQETEELVQLVINSYPADQPLKILEIGTGSGCISICLGNAFAKAELTAIDISTAALAVAQENADQLSRNNNITLKETDVLQLEKVKQYDIIISNPPYVRYLEKVEIHKNVLNYEPSQALFVDDDNPLLFYMKILELARPHRGTHIYFEINQYLKTQMQQLSESQGFKSQFYRDLSTNWRMMRCWQE